MAAGLHGGIGVTGSGGSGALTPKSERPILVETLRKFVHRRPHGKRGRSEQVKRAMAIAASDIERLIRASIPDAKVTIRDLAGDGDHYAATVIAESFRGKSRVQQHQIVYEALKGEMGGKLHALALQTGTPER